MGLQSCITIVESKKEPPLAFFEALVKKYPTAVSITLVDKDSMETLGLEKTFSPQDLLDVCKGNEDSRKIMWLCNTVEPLLNEDIQPFTIVEDEGTPLMVAFADGDFVGFVKSDSSFSAEYHAVEDWVKPQVNLLIEKSETVDEAIAALETTENGNSIKNELFGDQRGAFLLAAPDLVKMFKHKNSTELVQEWGLSTDHCGFGQQTQKSVQTTVVSAKDKFNRKTESATSTTSSASVSTPTAKDISATEDPPGVWVRKGPTVQANHLIKEWYNELFGFDKGAVIPPDILNKILAGTPVFLPKARFDNVRDKSIMKKTTMAEKPNKLDPKHIPQTPKPQSSGSVIPTPVMSKDTTKKVAEYFTKPGSLGTKLLENMDKEPITAEQAREVFEKHKDWSEQLKDEVKINVDWSFTLPYEAINDLARINPQTVAIMAWERGQRCIIANARIKELEILLKPQQIKEEGPRAETMAAPTSAKDRFKRKAG